MIFHRRADLNDGAACKVHEHHLVQLTSSRERIAADPSCQVQVQTSSTIQAGLEGGYAQVGPVFPGRRQGMRTYEGPTGSSTLPRTATAERTMAASARTNRGGGYPLHMSGIEMVGTRGWDDR